METVDGPTTPLPEERTYEFDTAEEKLIRDLARKMRWVAYFLIIVCLMLMLIGLGCFVVILPAGGFSTQGPGAILFIVGAVYLVIAFLTYEAGVFFQKIVDSEGEDIPHLMAALGNLRNLYRISFWGLLVAMTLIVLTTFFSFY